MKKETPKVSDAPIKHGKHTLHPGTLGHRRWLVERKNKTLMTGQVDFDSVLEICFAYTTEPLELQTFQGAKAKEAIVRFGDALTNDQFSYLQEHAEYQLLKFAETSVTPKKKPAAKAAKKDMSRVKSR